MKLRRILAPIDFSHVSEDALSYATGLAAEMGAEVLVLHAMEPVVYAGSPMSPEMSMANYLDEQREAATQSLEKLLARLRQRKVPVEGVVRSGPAYKVIVETAEESKCDLIVMGTHGRTGLGHLLLGSVAERVIRLAPCPVMTVRGTEKPSKPRK